MESRSITVFETKNKSCQTHWLSIIISDILHNTMGNYKIQQKKTLVLEIIMTIIFLFSKH